MLVKICGVTRIEDATLAYQLGADLIGLNFHPPSPRYVSIERAIEISRAVAGRARLVGVFVNAARDQIESVRRAAGLSMIQFHGDEPPEELRGYPVPVIRALRLKPGQAASLADSGAADFLLLDSYDPALFGGTGRVLAGADLARLDLSRVFIAGGLTPETVGAAAALHPYAVDVASGVESAPGLKDANKLRSFIANAKSSQ